jgi:hypothetical protein
MQIRGSEAEVSTVPGGEGFGMAGLGKLRGRPNPMADDLAREAVVFVACWISGWRHVWLPIGVFAWFLRAHHRSEYLTGQEAGATT